MSYINILTDDRNAISYRPKLRELTGSVTATILFQQILYWWEKMGRRPFYKFIEPCQHEKYKEGDSWSEELGFSRQEFATAIKKIAKKITKGTSKKEVFGNHLVIYWTDASRVTWFQVNEALVETRLHYLYNSGKSNYLETEEPRITFPTETTTETTTHMPTPGEEPPERDYLTDVVTFAKKERDNNRPKGYRDATEGEYRVCERVARLWTAGQLPAFARDIENALAGASYLLDLHGGDLRATLFTIDSLHADGVTDGINVASPYSLRNVVPNYLATDKSGKSDDGRSVEVMRDGKKVTVIK
jgi:hypothetical protein